MIYYDASRKVPRMLWIWPLISAFQPSCEAVAIFGLLAALVDAAVHFLFLVFVF